MKVVMLWLLYIPATYKEFSMKILMIGILALSSSFASAQAISVADLSNLLTARKVSLEAVNPGMSKRVVTNASYLTETGKICSYTQTAVQSILKIEGDKLIILSDETFTPAASDACKEAQLEAFQEKVLSYEAKPSLAEDLADLQAANVSSITRAGEMITMVVNGVLSNEDGTTTTELVTLKYDLTKSSFKNLMSTQTKDYLTTTTDMPDIDVSAANLTDVVFCASDDENECVRGDFSDILF